MEKKQDVSITLKPNNMIRVELSEDGTYMEMSEDTAEKIAHSLLTMVMKSRGYTGSLSLSLSMVNL